MKLVYTILLLTVALLIVVGPAAAGNITFSSVTGPTPQGFGSSTYNLVSTGFTQGDPGYPAFFSLKGVEIRCSQSGGCSGDATLTFDGKILGVSAR